MTDFSQIDAVDLKILKILEVNGRIPVTNLAESVGLSKTPVQARLKKLERDGVIRGYRAVIDPAVFKREQIAYVEVTLTDTREASLAAFDRAVRDVGAIEECHLIAGGFDYLLKVRTRDMADYRRVLGEVISNLPNIAKSTTYMVMAAVKDSTDQPE